MTLDELAQKIDHWRANKKSRVERIPKELWDEAVKLAKIYSPKEVAKSTGLNGGDIKRRLGILSLKSNNNINFKKLGPINNKPHTPIFEITTASGTIIKVYQ